MKNTKFRRRALISSIAMLLVALVAMGSATFAWFSTRPTADATGLAGATVKASSLNIKELWTDSWANTVNFANGGGSGSLDPVTFDGTNWKKTTAAAYNVGYAASSSLENTTMAAGSHYTTLYARYGEETGTETKTLSVKVTPDSSLSAAQLAYARVAIIPDATMDATNASDTLGNNSGAITVGTKIFASAADDRANTGVWTSASDAASSPALVWGASSTPTVLGVMTQGEVYGFYVCVYFEGTDPQCIDSNAGISVSNFKFDFSLS